MVRQMRSRAGLWAAGVAAAVGVAGAVSLATGTGDTQGSAMTSAQADVLALARFHDFQNGVSAIDATVPVSGQDFRLDGRVDWHGHLGYATLASSQQGDGTELLQWTPSGIAVHGSWTGPLPARPPADGWTVRAWQPGAELDTALQLILDLGSDRSENAQRLQQSGAEVLRRDSVGGTAVTVFAGPPENSTAAAHTRYWIADDGTLRRFEAQVDGSSTWTRVDLAPGRTPAVPHIPGMR